MYASSDTWLGLGLGSGSGGVGGGRVGVGGGDEGDEGDENLRQRTVQDPAGRGGAGLRVS